MMRPPPTSSSCVQCSAGMAPGVEADRDRQRAARSRRRMPLRHGAAGREAAVEADHEQWRGRRAAVEGVLDGGQLLDGQAERLFDEDVLAGPERADDQRGVLVVAGGMKTALMRRIGQDGASSVVTVEAELLARCAGGEAARRAERQQGEPLDLLERREDDGAREVAGRRCSRPRCRPRLRRRAGWMVGWRLGVVASGYSNTIPR